MSNEKQDYALYISGQIGIHKPENNVYSKFHVRITKDDLWELTNQLVNTKDEYINVFLDWLQKNQI